MRKGVGDSFGFDACNVREERLIGYFGQYFCFPSMKMGADHRAESGVSFFEEGFGGLVDDFGFSFFEADQVHAFAWKVGGLQGGSIWSGGFQNDRVHCISYGLYFET
jgi:hypothetical protein